MSSPIDRSLRAVPAAGTAAKAQQVLKRPDLAGKTGTTNDSIDAWFAGYTPLYSTAVWVDRSAA